MTAAEEADVRELRHQLTVFLMTGGLALALLEGSRRMNAHEGMAEWLRGGAVGVLLIGCTLSGLAMLASGVADLRKVAAPAIPGAPTRPRQATSRPRALFAVVLGGVLGVIVPVGLSAHLLGIGGF